MTARLLTSSSTVHILKNLPSLLTLRSANMCEYIQYNKKMIGSREVVGFGFNGEPSYIDRPDYPMPAIRWKESTPEVMVLREKEKGDWRKLTKDEKKQLYRASFRQTFAEFLASTGEWKSIVGWSLMVFSSALWLFMFMRYAIYGHTTLPPTFDEEHQQAQLRRIIDLQMNPITGISSKWDYDKDDWKKIK